MSQGVSPRLTLNKWPHTDSTAAEDKNNNLMSSEGMEATEEEMLDSFADEDAIIDGDEDDDI